MTLRTPFQGSKSDVGIVGPQRAVPVWCCHQINGDLWIFVAEPRQHARQQSKCQIEVCAYPDSAGGTSAVVIRCSDQFVGFVGDALGAFEQTLARGCKQDAVRPAVQKPSDQLKLPAAPAVEAPLSDECPARLQRGSGIRIARRYGKFADHPSRACVALLHIYVRERAILLQMN